MPEEYALWGLLHDASEAYLADIARPIKHDPSENFGEVYRKYEGILSKAVAETFNLEWPEPPEVKEWDTELLRAEQRDLMPNDPTEESRYTKTIEPWLPPKAERKFLERYEELLP